MKHITNITVCYLDNPWSGATSTMTWAEIKIWAADHIHENDRRQWLNKARKAAKSGDAKTLGAMIIGS